MFNCPLSSEKAKRLIEQLNLQPHDRVLDIGCGDGELLLQIAEQYDIQGTGIDLNADLITKAEQKAEQRNLSDRITFLCENARSFPWASHPAKLMICIGSEFSIGGYQQALQLFSHCLPEAGFALIGNVFWQQEPVPEYLELMGGENPHFDYLTTVELAIASGFIPLYLCRSNEDEWDDFESRHAQKRYLAALENADDTAFQQIQTWQRAYLKWGRNTMGFGFFLLQKR